MAKLALASHREKYAERMYLSGQRDRIKHLASLLTQIIQREQEQNPMGTLIEDVQDAKNLQWRSKVDAYFSDTTKV